jgi:hypothetical protein
LVDKNLAPGRHPKLAICNDALSGLYSALDNYQVSLSLAQRHSPLFGS